MFTKTQNDAFLAVIILTLSFAFCTTTIYMNKAKTCDVVGTLKTIFFDQMLINDGQLSKEKINRSRPVPMCGELFHWSNKSFPMDKNYRKGINTILVLIHDQEIQKWFPDNDSCCHLYMMEKVDEVCIPYAEFFPLNVRDDLICMPRVWYWTIFALCVHQNVVVVFFGCHYLYWFWNSDTAKTMYKCINRVFQEILYWLVRRTVTPTYGKCLGLWTRLVGPTVPLDQLDNFLVKSIFKKMSPTAKFRSSCSSSVFLHLWKTTPTIVNISKLTIFAIENEIYCAPGSYNHLPRMYRKNYGVEDFFYHFEKYHYKTIYVVRSYGPKKKAMKKLYWRLLKVTPASTIVLLSR